MCFSASASFSASFILLIIGILTLRKVSKSSQYPAALIPLLFSFQQASEGIVWLTVNSPYVLLQKITTYAFLFFAVGVWPIWMPYSLMLLENNPRRKRLLSALFGLGIILSGILVEQLITNGTQAEIVNHHIQYSSWQTGNDSMLIFFTIWYFLVTVLGSFISSVPWAWILGLAVTMAYVVSYYFYYYALGSIWCFFAALISIITYFIIAQPKTRFKRK